MLTTTAIYGRLHHLLFSHFIEFLKERIKVDGKTGNLGSVVQVVAE